VELLTDLGQCMAALNYITADSVGSVYDSSIYGTADSVGSVNDSSIYGNADC